MGLISEFRAYKKKKQIENLLSDLGLSNIAEEIKSLKDHVSSLEQRVSELENNASKVQEVSAEEDKKTKLKYENAVTPQDVVAMFADENVEYLPNAYGTKQA